MNKSPDFMDRLKAEVAAANHLTPDQSPVTYSSLTYGDLREMLAILSEIHAPLSDSEQGEAKQTMTDLLGTVATVLVWWGLAWLILQGKAWG